MENDNTQSFENEQFEQEEKAELTESLEVSAFLNEPKPKRQKKPADQINYLDKQKADLLIQTIKNEKHRTAILLMLDCGLRVTECVTLQLKNFDFRNKLVIVRSLKKRGDEVQRKIPISTRLMEQLAIYLQQLKPQGEEAYLFPGNNGRKHLARKALWKVCNQLREKNPAFSKLHPHALRHTFATQLLANGAALHNVKELLGHSDYNTTLIYNHTPIELLRQNIDAMTKEKRPVLQRLKEFFFPRRSPAIIAISANPQNFLVGREGELTKLLDCVNKNINVILLGRIGVGKTHLLRQLDQLQNRKVIKLDELTNLKMTFVNVLVYLYDNDKEAVRSLVFPDYDRTKMIQKFQRDNVMNLIEEIKKITQPHEYILSIESVDGITAKGMKCMEALKDHFTIVTTAREVPVSKANFLWNFERMDIKNLDRTSSLELIHRLSYDMEIEDYELYRNHIYDQSAGNPRVIFELCERFRKEIVLTDDVIRSVRHIGGLPEIDMSFIVVFILAGLTVLRYASREIGGQNLRFIGGIALVLLMLSRFFLTKIKRRTL